MQWLIVPVTKKLSDRQMIRVGNCCVQLNIADLEPVVILNEKSIEVLLEDVGEIEQVNTVYLLKGNKYYLSVLDGLEKWVKQEVANIGEEKAVFFDCTLLSMDETCSVLSIYAKIWVRSFPGVEKLIVMCNYNELSGLAQEIEKLCYIQPILPSRFEYEGMYDAVIEFINKMEMATGNKQMAISVLVNKVKKLLGFLKKEEYFTIFGVGSSSFLLSYFITEVLGDYFKIKAYLDNGNSKRVFLGFRVYNPSEMKENIADFSPIVVASQSYDEIRSQLMSLGLVEDMNFFNGFEIVELLEVVLRSGQFDSENFANDVMPKELVLRLKKEIDLCTEGCGNVEV